MKNKNGYVLRKIADESVVVPVGEDMTRSNALFILNETSAFLWQYIENGIDADSLVTELISEYDVDSDTARNDVNIFIVELNKLSLLEF